jgi:ketoreductase RED1
VGSTTQRTVAVIGTGTIGLGWITLLLANGHRVRANGRNPELARIVREGVELFAPTMPGGAADPAELLSRLEIEPVLERAVDGAEVVQENLREDVALKQEYFARIGRAAPPGSLLLSSSSSLPVDDIGATMSDPSRLLIGHPFNPPHVIPLVEVIPGAHTDPQATEQAVDFYRGLGKTPVVLRKQIAGTLANRLQSALFREAVHLVLEGVVTVDELDTAVTESIGLRWACVGPFQAFHLGGGPGGLRHLLNHVGPKMEREWRRLGQPKLDENVIETLAAQAESAFGDRSYQQLAAERDARQNAVLQARTGNGPV